jgi:hypothetical protein
MPRRSAVFDLPEHIKSALDKRLAEGGFQDYKGLSDWLALMGWQLSKSAIHRYGQNFAEKLSTLKLVTEQAKAVVEAAPDKEGAVNDALVRLVQEKLFGVLIDLDPAVLKQEKLSYLAKAIADLGRASVQQKQWMAKVAERARDTAAEVAEVARKSGLSDLAVEDIRRRILGVAE